MTLPLDRLRGIVADSILDAAEIAAEALRKEQIPFAICGGLAVSAMGYERTTKDVDFLVSDRAYIQHAGGLVTLRLPIYTINGVGIDLVPEDDVTRLELIEMSSAHSRELQVVSPEVLTYMKLAAGRFHDINDLMQLIIRGKIDVTSVTAWLTQKAPKFLPAWAKILQAVKLERE